MQHVIGAARAMRRLIALAAVLIVAAIAVAVANGSSSSAGGTYLVRAIFDDASFAAQGEDVRIAGANVGSIQSLGVTAGKKAAVTLAITNPGFRPGTRTPPAPSDRSR